MRVLVTGGTGFLGRELIPLLLEKGYSVRVMSRRKVKVPGCETVQGNFADPGDAGKAVKGVDVVVHLAKLKGHNRPYKEHEKVTVRGTENLLRACLDQGVGRFVHMSSIAARLENVTPYARAKREAEEAVKKYWKKGVKAPILRAALVYDAGKLRQLKRLTFFPIPCGDQTLHLSYKKSVAEALANAVEKGRNKVYEIGDKNPVKAKEFYRELARPRPVVFSPAQVRWAMVLAGYPVQAVYNALKKNPPLTPRFARYLFENRVLDTREGVRDLGYEQVDTIEKVRELKKEGML